MVETSVNMVAFEPYQRRKLRFQDVKLTGALNERSVIDQTQCERGSWPGMTCRLRNATWTATQCRGEICLH
jgi:hypothetical protein